MRERFAAEYILRTCGDPRRAADVIAGEQSSGTFIATPGEDAALKARSAARVETLEEVADPGTPVLPGSAGSGPTTSWRMRLSWPLGTVGPSIPNLLATVAGNLTELKQVAGIKVTALDLPDAFFEAYPGPAFGIDGTRRMAGVENRPLIGTIIKPSVGLTPEETAALCDQLCAGGIDFIKDDELQSDGPHCPFEARFAAVMDVIDRHADRTGRKVMYAVNVTGEIHQMARRHDIVAERGGTCVMVSLNAVGPAGLTALRRVSTLPIHAHRNGWGMLGRPPDSGWTFPAWATIWRLAGADHMHVNGIANKFWEPDDSVIAAARHCHMPLSAKHPYLVMPVFSSGQTVMQAAPTYAAIGSTDIIFCAGGGIIAHPSGVAAGVTSLRAAWDAAVAGVPLADAAAGSTVLAEAVDTFS